MEHHQQGKEATTRVQDGHTNRASNEHANAATVVEGLLMRL
jgi:hypothetical protein